MEKHNKNDFLEIRDQCTLELLLRCSRLINTQAVQMAQLKESIKISPTHMQIIPHIQVQGSQGTRITELAKTLGLHKQSVSRLVEDLVEQGLLEKAPDPTDARAKLVRFTERGRQVTMIGLEALMDIQKDIEDILGKEDVLSLHITLTKIVRIFNGLKESNKVSQML